MNRILAICALLFLMMCGAAFAQTNASVGKNSQPAPVSSTQGGFVGNDGTLQPVSASNPLPVNATVTATIGSLAPYQLTPLAGQQTLVLTSSAQALTVPATATIADFFPEGTGGTNGNCARYRDDGTAPTATVGSPLQPGQLLLGYSVKPAGAALSTTQFILATGATCTLTINYYK